MLPPAHSHAPSSGSAHAANCRVVVLDALDSAAIREIIDARLPQVEPVLADSLSAALERDGPVLVVMTSPHQSLAASLAEAGDAARAVVRWTARHRELLALVRRHRQRLTLVDAALLTRDDDDDWSVVARRLGGATVHPGKPLALPPPDAAPALFRLAAIAIGRCNAETAEVIADLDAATLGRGRTDETRMVLDAVRDWHNHRNGLGPLRDALAVQPGTYDPTPAESADRRHDATSPERRLQVLLSEHKNALDALAKAEESVASLTESQSHLKEDLTLQLEAAETQRRRHAQDVAAIQESGKAAIDDAVSRAAQAEQMAQVERTAREQQTKQSAETMSRRDAVLGAQLLTQARTTAELRADLSRLVHDLNAATTQLSQANEARDRLDAQTEQQKAEIDALSQELDRVYSSRSWRMTGPLRAAIARRRSPRR